MKQITHSITASDFSIDKLFGISGGSAVPFNVTYNVLPLSSTPETWLQRKMLKRVVVVLGFGKVACDLTLSVWDFGNTMTLYPEEPDCHDHNAAPFTFTKAVGASSGHLEYRIITFYPQILCRWPMIALSGTAQSDLRIKAIQVEWENQAQDDLPSDY